MAHPVEWDSLLALLAGALALVLAGFVFLTGPARRPNRRLALLLFLEGTLQLGAGMWNAFAHTRAEVVGFQGVLWASLLALPALYLRFLATLDTPLVRPLRARPADALLRVAAVALPAMWFLDPTRFTHAPDDAPLIAFVGLGGFAATSLFGLAAAISAFRRAPAGSLARRRAKAYAAAFGSRDLLFGTFILGTLGALVLGGVEAIEALPPGFNEAPILATILFVLLMAVGILRTQLFDIDVRIKWTVKQSTVAAAFVAVFFVVSEGAEQLLSSQVGPLLGIAAAALLVFAIAPLQRAAERVADLAMPGVKPLSELGGAERAAIYREQLRLAWADGVLERAERVLLDDLRERLGVSPQEALRIEREVVRGGPA